MFKVLTPPNYEMERRYIIDVLLREFLGLSCHVQVQDRSDVAIQDSGQKKILLPDIFFKTPAHQWLKPSSFPAEPLSNLEITETAVDHPSTFSEIPVLFGIKEHPTSNYHLPIDIFGSAFFMLTRYEECVCQCRDAHHRFSAKDSIAYRNGFISRPLINEYIEILWSVLSKVWPGLKRKKRVFRMISSHDIDIPFEYLQRPLYKMFIKTAVEIHHGRGLKQLNHNLHQWWKINQRGLMDPYDTFDWIIQTLKGSSAKAVFNFMSGGRLPVDYYYSLNSSAIRQLIKKIANHGWEIGFHPSYNTMLNERLWSSELNRLKNVMGDIPIKGGRQHFLRFEVPTTWRFYAAHGLQYDSSLGFADHAGFRCGICYEYPVFDLLNKKALKLNERPLIAMDGTIIDDKYMGLGPSKNALEYLLSLKNICRKYNGDFVLLWHNQRFVDEREKDIFRQIIH